MLHFKLHGIFCMRNLIKDALLIELRRKEKGSAPYRIQTHGLPIWKRVLYRYVTTAMALLG